LVILSLGAMSFLLADLMHRFVYLDEMDLAEMNLDAVLVFVGAKMCWLDLGKVLIGISLT
jgi:predicted tellurium resistance membrane protein TerC